jgi:putative hydrolase of the HAD superfamily
MKTVLFDYGNVVSLPQAPEDVARMAGGDPGFEDRYWEVRLDFDRGSLDPAAYWSHVYGRPMGGADLDAVVALDVASWSRPNEETVAIIDELAGVGVPMALLSNMPVCVAEGIDGLPFMRPIGPRFYSGRMGLVKPDPGIFHETVAWLGVAPGDLVFVDDRLENVAAAERAGLAAVHFRDAAALREDLKPLLA